MRPAERIDAYFGACSGGSAADVAAHFTPDAVIFDSNVGPTVGSDEIGSMWTKVRRRWGGARWSVDSIVEAADGSAAAIEWRMAGIDPTSGRRFVFRGSEHYRFRDTLIAEIRQYWTFDRERLDTGLVGYPYDAADR